MNRIDKRFQDLRKSKAKAFVVYLTVGYPDITTSEKLILGFSKAGVDIFELGVPFSDPLADGPVIQEAGSYALKHKISLDSVFSLAKRLRAKINNPLLIMGYFNPILNYGLGRFAKNAYLSGLDGIIVPDLPIEEARELRSFLDKYNIHLIDFIAPTTDFSRIKKISKKAKGFIYYVSLTGVTGTRDKLPKDILERMNYLRKFIKIPICVGFGISQRGQLKSVAKLSDGVIVGSAIIKKISENLGKNNLVPNVVKFVKNLIN